MNRPLEATLLTIGVLVLAPTAGPMCGPALAVETVQEELGREVGIDLRLPFDAPELVDPRSVLPNLGAHPAQELAALYRYSGSCDEAELGWVRHPSLVKARLWHRSQCDEGVALSPHFFEAEPRFHPGGSSFVALAARSGRARFDLDWLRENADRLHVLESGLLVDAGLPLSNDRRALHRLAPRALRDLVDREPLVVADLHVFVLDTAHGPTDPGLYRAYPRSRYDALLVPPRATLSQALTVGTLVGLALLGFIALMQAFRRVRLRRQLMHERARVLRTLAHEVRTPTTSLKLVLEELREGYDELPPAAQKGFLALCDEVHRLERVIHESRRYLGASHDDPTRAYRRVPIESVNAFVEGVIEPYRKRLTFEPLDEDPGVETDPYWFAVCIRNLVENALTHGAPPVAVRLWADRRRLHVTVCDGGTAEARELQRGLRPFLRARASPGLGLGLAIVSDTVTGLRGKLTWSTRPTSFTMSLRRSA